MQLCSCAHGVPKSRVQTPRATLRSSKWCRNWSHSAGVRSRYSSRVAVLGGGAMKAMSRSVLPHRRLVSIDERLEHAAARPVIIPETIVVDQGSVFISRNFRSSCAWLGINFQPTHPGSPAEKPHVEKRMSSVGTLFAQFVSGYAGSNTERRGRKVEAQPLWSMLELQELLDEWIVGVFTDRWNPDTSPDLRSFVDYMSAMAAGRCCCRSSGWCCRRTSSSAEPRTPARAEHPRHR